MTLFEKIDHRGTIRASTVDAETLFRVIKDNLLRLNVFSVKVSAMTVRQV